MMEAHTMHAGRPVGKSGASRTRGAWSAQCIRATSQSAIVPSTTGFTASDESDA